MSSTFKVSFEIKGLDNFKELADDVIQKADELQKAIQRLNDVELILQTKSASD